MTRIAVIGARGHGVRHRQVIHRLAAAGRVRLVAVASRTAVAGAPDAPLGGVAVFHNHRDLLERARPDIVVVCTPPHTHLATATDAVAAGADLLLEKPPTTSLAEHAQLTAAVARHGAACQVGFQALGSPTLAEVTEAARAGLLGTVHRLTVAGAWWRPDSYYRRSDWAGRRHLDGRRVIDGALLNQFGHAIMQCLALAEELSAAGGAWPVRLELERYRCRDIEVEDTGCLRITLAGGLTVLLAVTVSAAGRISGDIQVIGDRARADLDYPNDRVRLPTDPQWRVLSGRIGLLENLLDHRADHTVGLLARLDRTAGFTALAEAVSAAPPPARIPDRHLRPHPDGGRVIVGIEQTVRRAAARALLFSELAVPWAVPPYRVQINAPDPRPDRR